MDNVLIVVNDLAATKAFFVPLGMELEGETTVAGRIANGVPRPSPIRWRFDPVLPRSVGVGPVFWPPWRGYARWMQRGPLPIDLVQPRRGAGVRPGGARPTRQRGANLVSAATRSSRYYSPSRAATGPTGCRS